MVKAYRALQQWNSWLTESGGKALLSLEATYLAKQLQQFTGQYALLLGVPAQIELLKANEMRFPMLATKLPISDAPLTAFESDYAALPVASGSIDLVIVAHTLDYATHPHRLLIEACRVVRPDGHIVIMGFNPHSLWGLKKIWMKNQSCPWDAHFLSSQKIVNWLKLAEFSLIKQDGLLFSLPFPEKKFFQQLNFFELIGKRLYNPFGGVYFLLAQAKVIPLTPIRLQWKQGLKSFQPNGLIGSIGRVIS